MSQNEYEDREERRTWRGALDKAVSNASARERALSCEKETASVTQLSIDTGAFDDDVDSFVFPERNASTPGSALKDRGEETETVSSRAATVRHLSLDSLQQVGLTTGAASDEEEDEAEADSSDEVSVLSLPTPPDGGWGWVVVLAAFIVNMIVDGISCSYGIFLIILEDEFGASKSQTALVGSLFWGVPLLAAPLSSPLINKFGCRLVCMAGGFLTFVGVFLAQFVTSLEYLCLFYGVVAGLGLSMVALPSTIIVSYYFESRRAFATGLSVAGSGVGTFVFAPLTDYLVEHYHWRSYMLLLSAVVLNLTVCGALFRPIETKLEKRQRTLLYALERFSKQCSKDASLQSSLQSIAYMQSDVSTRLQFIKQALSEPSSFVSLKQFTDSDERSDSDFRLTLLSEPPTTTSAVSPLQAIPEHEVVEEFTDSVPLPIVTLSPFDLEVDSLNYSRDSDQPVNVAAEIDAIAGLERRDESDEYLFADRDNSAVRSAAGLLTEFDDRDERRRNISRSSEELRTSRTDNSDANSRRRKRRKSPRKQTRKSKEKEEEKNSVSAVNTNGTNSINSSNEQVQKRFKPSSQTPQRAVANGNPVSNTSEAGATSANSPSVAGGPGGPCGPGGSGAGGPVAVRAARPKVFGQHLRHHGAANRLRRATGGAVETGDADGSTVIWVRTNTQSDAVLLPAAMYSRAQFAPLNRRDIFYRGTLENVPLYRTYKTASCPELYRPASISSGEDDAFDKFVDILRLKSAKQVIKVMLDVKLFGNLAFLLFFLSNFLLFVGYNVAYFFLTDYAMSRDVSSQRAPLLISVIGIFNTVGQVAIGYVGDRPEVNTVLVYSVCIAITGVGTMLVPSLVEIFGLAAYAAVFGFFFSANMSLCTIIMVEAIGLERLTNGFSLVMCGQGVANIIGPPLLGWIIVYTGDFPAAFYTGGILLLASAAFIIFVPLLQRFACDDKTCVEAPNAQNDELTQTVVPEVADDANNDTHSRTHSFHRSQSQISRASFKDRASASDVETAPMATDNNADCTSTHKHLKFMVCEEDDSRV